MTAIVVTRAGKGDAYSFKSVLLADSHPITQFGDPIMSNSTHLRQCLTKDECISLAKRLGMSAFAKELEYMHRSDLERGFDELWEGILKSTSSPPSDPSEVMKIITSDRVATRVTGIHLRPRGEFEMTEHAHVETTEAPAAAEVAEKKHRPIPKEPKFAETSVISMLKDKEGNAYGGENNPKKLSSASHERFSKYEDGMTIKQAKDAGVLNGDFDNDTKKGYISVS